MSNKVRIGTRLRFAAYFLLTMGDRMRLYIARSEGCRVVKGPVGWDGSNLYAIRSMPPQERDFLTWDEFKRDCADGAKGG